ncbi:melanopsin-B-like, partial [Paramuricea clavata]
MKFHKKLLKDPKDILTFSLAIGDFVISLIITPLAFSSAVAKKWTTGKSGCIRNNMVCRNAAATWGSNAQVTRHTYTAQVKITKQLVVVTCGFLTAWTPYAVMSSLRVLTDIEFDNGWYELPSLFAKTANIYNPIVYFFMYRRLRQHVFIMLDET